tara:strand:+ start:165 stop:425 length:261 start_codon:yes stop_codon:yes gene_type:complete
MKDDKPLYKPFRSTSKNKKYAVYVMRDGKVRKINFGDSRYGQYKDKLGEFSSLDHGDPKRRKAYFDRHGRTTDKNTALYWSNKILW